MNPPEPSGHGNAPHHRGALITWGSLTTLNRVLDMIDYSEPGSTALPWTPLALLGGHPDHRWLSSAVLAPLRQAMTLPVAEHSPVADHSMA